MMKIELYIPKKPLSRNIKNNDAVQAYKAEVRDILRDRYPNVRIPDTIKAVAVRYHFGVSNKRTDVDNLQKYAQDAIFEHLGVDDRIVEAPDLRRRFVEGGDEFIWALIRPYDKDYYLKQNQAREDAQKEREARWLQDARDNAFEILKKNLYLLDAWSVLTGDIAPKAAMERAIPQPETLEEDDWWDISRRCYSPEKLIVFFYPDCDKKELNDFVETLPYLPACAHGIADKWEWVWKRYANGNHTLWRFCAECGIVSRYPTPQRDVPICHRRAAYLWQDGEKTDIQPKNDENFDAKKPERVPKAQTQRDLLRAIIHATSQLTHQNHAVTWKRLYAKLEKRHGYPPDSVNISMIEEKGLLSDFLEIAWETYQDAEA